MSYFPDPVYTPQGFIMNRSGVQLTETESQRPARLTNTAAISGTQVTETESQPA